MIQKIIECLPKEKLDFIIQSFQGQVMQLSTHPYGCRVIQRILEHCQDDHVNSVLEVNISPNSFYLGNFYPLPHFSLSLSSLVISVLIRDVRYTPYASFQEIHRKSDILIADQYGNYVIQHILEHGANPDRQRVLTSVKGRIVQLSQHKFASNVIEKCVTSSSREDRVIIINEVCQNPGIDRTFSLVS